MDLRVGTLPALRIPFKGGAGASSVRTIWGGGRGRSATEDSRAEV